MKQALVIFNGLKFPHHLAEHAISHCKEQSAALHALFLAGHEKEEGYIFPSDLDAAQDATDKHDAERSDLRVIDSQVKLLEHMAKSGGVVFKTEILVNPELDDVLSRAKTADVIFIDADYEDTGLMAVTSFGMKDLLDELPSGLNWLLKMMRPD